MASIAAVGFWGLNFGIDFTGGSLMEFAFSGARPPASELQQRITDLGATRVKAQMSGDRSAFVRAAPMTQEVHRRIVDAFASQAIEHRYESIGPSVGQELARKTVIGVLLAIIVIVCYVAWVFRKAGKLVSSWMYGFVALVAMAHDVIIPIGVFA
ncbi:MAG: hypothetical protein Q8R16_05570, partial [bacterium]|nr:hypothetical protein [bacterium]